MPSIEKIRLDQSLIAEHHITDSEGWGEGQGGIVDRYQKVYHKIMNDTF